MSGRRGASRNRGGGESRGRGGGGEPRGRGGSHGGGESSRGRGGGGDLPYRPRGHSSSRGRGRGASSSPRGGGGGGPSVYEPGFTPELDQKASESEDGVMQTLKHDPSPTLPKRPRYGSKGAPVLLFANYFQFDIDGSPTLYRYAIGFADKKNQPVGKKLGRVIQLLMEQLNNPHGIASDLRTLLVSRTEINPPEEGYTVQYRAEGEDLSDSAQSYQVHLLEPKSLALGTLTQTTTTLQDTQELIQALNIIVGQHPKSQDGVANAGRNRYVSIDARQENRPLSGGLLALRAFVFSVRKATERMLVNIQLKNLPFYEPGPLTDLVNAFGLHSGYDYHQLAAFLRRLSVEVTHLPTKRNKAGNPIRKYKTIFGLANLKDGQKKDGKQLPNPPRVKKFGAGPNDVEFFLHDAPAAAGPLQASHQPATGASGKGKQPQGSGNGEYISVYNFFKSRYGTIMNPNLPVVNVGSVENPSYLPLEVCVVRPGQHAPGKISSDQTATMIGFAVRRPALNAKSIVSSGLDLLGLRGGNVYLSAFGMTVRDKMITVPGRVMPAPSIIYANQAQMQPLGGSWNLQGIKVLHAMHLRNWKPVVISKNGHSALRVDEFKRVFSGFAAGLRSMGLRVDQPKKILEIDISSDNKEDKIRKTLEALKSDKQECPEFLLVVVPHSDPTSVYNIVKRVCDVDLGLKNVCVKDTKLPEARPQYYANVGLKVNLKLGGCNHAVHADELGGISAKYTMFVGLDVTHPSPGSSDSAPSVAGIVSSVDEYLAQWPADIRVQTARKEMVEPLKEMMTGCLLRWRKRNDGRLPRNIIIYRDGVSEGQYKTVLDEELPHLRKAMEDIYPAQATETGFPKVSIIIVGKRHHTRFYATKPEDADGKGNPKSGTVVDRGVTEVANWDFFLQAHTAIQGTARPAHYYVIYDEIFRERSSGSNMSATDALEQLSHSLCYSFGRATKAVSVCPPAYYADLACERARNYLHNVYNSASASSDGSEAGRQGAAAAAMAENARASKVHDDVKESMYYI